MSSETSQGFLQRATAILYTVENAFYVVIAVALAMSGAALFGDTLFQFVADVGESAVDLKGALLDVLDGLLLVFIVAELLHTVRAVMGEALLRPEPFLVVGIVAVIRRLIVISAEAPEFLGDPRFFDLMLEMGVLIGGALGLGATIFLLGRRRPAGSQPQEPDDAAPSRQDPHAG